MGTGPDRPADRDPADQGRRPGGVAGRARQPSSRQRRCAHRAARRASDPPQLDTTAAKLWADGHVTVGALWRLYAEYPYMPRLRDRAVLNVGLTGPQLLWEQEGFALLSAARFRDGGAVVGRHRRGERPNDRRVVGAIRRVRNDRTTEGLVAKERRTERPGLVAGCGQCGVVAVGVGLAVQSSAGRPAVRARWRVILPAACSAVSAWSMRATGWLR